MASKPDFTADALATRETGIPFTQYLMPDGRQQSVWIDRPSDIESKARSIIDAGYRFECEMLRDYATVSLTIVHPDDGDVAIKVVPNGPAVPDAIDKMVASFRLDS